MKLEEQGVVGNSTDLSSTFMWNLPQYPNSPNSRKMVCLYPFSLLLDCSLRNALCNRLVYILPHKPPES